MPPKAEVGGLKIAEMTAAYFAGVLARLPEGTRLSPREVLDLYTDCNRQVVLAAGARIAGTPEARDADVRAFVKKMRDRGVPLPPDRGVLSRLVGE